MDYLIGRPRAWRLVEYYATATDVSSTAPSGVNAVTQLQPTVSKLETLTRCLLLNGTTSIFLQHSKLCDYQAVFYDVTNEIEFKYDTNCATNEDYSTVGYMDQTKKIGATLREEAGILRMEYENKRLR